MQKTSLLSNHVLICRLRPALVICALLLLLPFTGAQAQPVTVPVLITLGGESAASAPVPANAELVESIRIDRLLLKKTQPGDLFSVQVNASFSPLMRMRETDTFINGDQVFLAHGLKGDRLFSLVLTLGEQSLYGHISSSEGSFQISAVSDGDTLYGWLYRPLGLGESTGGLQNDYILPRVERSEGIARPEVSLAPQLVLPLAVQSTLSERPDNYAPATQSQINSANFSITQSASRSSILVNQSVSVQLQFRNTGNSSHSDLSVDIYFVLENSQLISAPNTCRQRLSTSLQTILQCQLGNFSAGESKSLSYTVRASLQSKPAIVSTAIVGSLRSDFFVNVVEDVRKDSDLDGISDFNELLIGTDPYNSASVDHSLVTIDVMALYTQGAIERFPAGVKTRINQLISVANQAYADSGVGIRLRPVYHGPVHYRDDSDMDTALSHLINKSDPAFAGVNSLRSLYGADLVMLFRPLSGDTSKCGLATVGGFATLGDFSAAAEKEFAYSHIGIDCPVDTVLVHELGHNMGLTHSHREDGTGGTFNFSTGHGVDSSFVTIMAYPGAFKTTTRIAMFSNPDRDCLGRPCGIHADDQFGADAVQSLNLVKYQIANYFPTRVPQMPVKTVVAYSGQTTTASIALAASTDRGLSYAQSISPGDSADITASVMVDSRHVGMKGYFVVLGQINEKEYLELGEDGSVSVWDGTVEGLRKYSALRELRSVEYFRLAESLVVLPSMLGQQISLYIAYLVPALGEVIYNAEPLVISVTAK